MRAAAHRVPLRPVAQLQQAVVVAEADQRADRKAQHLRRRARPDAADHRQQVVVAEGGAEPVRGEKVGERQCKRRIGAGLGQRGRQPVEAQEVEQHAVEARPQQVAAVGEHGVQAGARPFEPAVATRRLHRERHPGGGAVHGQFVEQRDEARVGATVEDEEAG